MTKFMRYFCAPTVALLTVLGGSPAATASSGDDPPPTPPWAPADTNGDFIPVAEDYYSPYEVPACGTTVKVAPGEARNIKYKVTHKDDGSVRVVYRGKATVDLTRLSDGATIDELDVSGRFSEHYGPDGLSVTLTAWGPSIIAAFSEVEAAALAEEGLPPFVYFKSGKISGTFVFSDTARSSVVSVDTRYNTVERSRDVCRMLDRASAEQCSEETMSTGSDCLLPPRPAPDESADAAADANTAVAATCPPEVANCQYQPTMYDIDGNGFYDPYVADGNGNGFLDRNLVAANGVLIWLFDTNENSIPEQYGADTNADAVPDIWVVDVNEDYILDQIVIDPAVHSTTPTVSSTGGTTLIIDPGHIPLSPAGLTAAVDGLLIPGARTPTDFCTFLNSAALLGTNYGCYYR
jgi:hypothetical protein